MLLYSIGLKFKRQSYSYGCVCVCVCVLFRVQLILYIGHWSSVFITNILMYIGTLGAHRSKALIVSRKCG